MFNFACKACGNSDKTTDTVKVSFPQVNAEDKENAAPEADQPDKLQEEQRRLEQEAEERRQREEAERLRREQEERLRREEEQRLAAERQRAEEERRRKELEAQRIREVEERKEAEMRRQAEEAKRQEQLGAFLAKNGFAGANDKKKKSGLLSSGFAYPLHAAVRSADAQAVGLLLWAGADRSFKDSAKLTPLALAQKLDKKGSHRLVIDALSA